MTNPVPIALAQLNAHLGNIDANISRLAGARANAAANGAKIIVTPEMYLSGYPCDDLVLRDDFMNDVAIGIDKLAALTSDGGPAIAVGAPTKDSGRIYNSVFVLDDGKQIARFDKVNLPNYGVFDDKRNFTAGQMPGPIMLRGLKIGFPICEDIWEPDVAECLEESGADLIIAMNASPFDSTKPERRMQNVIARGVETGLPVIYVNMIGGQDELVYDGGSFAINTGGNLASCAPSFSESVLVVTAQKSMGVLTLTGQLSPPDSDLTAIYRGLCLGLRDYVQKNGFPGVVLGLSGGIDSAVTSTLCAKSGLETIAVNMPIHQESSQYDLAKRHIEWLESRWANVSSHLVDLTESYDSYVESALDGLEISELSLANTRARLRMTTLYAISGSRKGIVVGTGNKVEDFGVGFYTKYGDGGVDISPIADLLKSEVYALAKEMSVIEDIQNSIPNDGLWADGRTDEDQIGATYEEIEWAMAQADRAQREGLSNRQKEVLRIYQKLHESNSHKMKPIPIYIKNS